MNARSAAVTVNCVALVFVFASAIIAFGPVFAAVGAAASFVIAVFIVAFISTASSTPARSRVARPRLAREFHKVPAVVSSHQEIDAANDAPRV